MQKWIGQLFLSLFLFGFATASYADRALAVFQGSESPTGFIIVREQQNLIYYEYYKDSYLPEFSMEMESRPTPTKFLGSNVEGPKGKIGFTRSELERRLLDYEDASVHNAPLVATVVATGISLYGLYRSNSQIVGGKRVINWREFKVFRRPTFYGIGAGLILAYLAYLAVEAPTDEQQALSKTLDNLDGAMVDPYTNIQQVPTIPISGPIDDFAESLDTALAQIRNGRY